jgi:hypothetical protein
MMARTIRRLAAVTALALAGVATAAPTQAAIVPSAKIVDSGCTSQQKPMKWIGSDSKDRYSWPRPEGTVYVCFAVYKFNDGNPKADYYAVVATSYWKHTKGTRSFEAKAYQSIHSSARSIKNYYSATSGFTANKSCSDPISISASVPGLPISIGVKPKVCKGYKVVRTEYSESKASWRADKAAGLRVLETAFSQEVKQGAKPRYAIGFAIPRYIYVYATPRDYTKPAFKRVYFTSERR